MHIRTNALHALTLIVSLAACAAPAGDGPDRAVATGAGADTGGNDTGAGAGPAAEDTAGDAAWPTEDGAGGDADTPAPDSREPDACAALVLRELSVVDEDDDGHWMPGEQLWVQVALVNEGDATVYDAPGAVLAVHEADALIPEGYAGVYSLDPGAQALLRWWVVAAPTPSAARSVAFEINVVTAPSGTPITCIGGAQLPFAVDLGVAGDEASARPAAGPHVRGARKAACPRGTAHHGNDCGPTPSAGPAAAAPITRR